MTSAEASAQTPIRIPILKSAPADSGSAVPGPCTATFDARVIAQSFGQQYYESLKARIAAHDACVSECVSRSMSAVSGNDDPEDPKDFGISDLLGLCQASCSS
jgi:hypothetical protein